MRVSCWLYKADSLTLGAGKLRNMLRSVSAMEDKSKRRRQMTLYETLVKASRKNPSWLHRRALAGACMRKTRLLPALAEDMIAQMRRLVAEKDIVQIKRLLYGPRAHSLKRLIQIQLQLCMEDAAHVDENQAFIEPLRQVMHEEHVLFAELWMLVTLQRVDSNCAKCRRQSHERLSLLRGILPHRAKLIDRALARRRERLTPKELA